MARDHARLRQSVWADEEFRALPGEAQRLYFVALSQPALNYCGVVPYTIRRWARLSKDGSETKIKRAVHDLTAARYVLTDLDTEELWVRTFIKNDGLLSSPNICKAVVKAFPTIHSALLRAAFLAELHRINGGPQEEGWDKGWTELAHLLGEPFPKGFPEGLPEGFRDSRVRAAPDPSPDPVLAPKCEHDLFPGLCTVCRGKVVPIPRESMAVLADEPESA